ncbi:MAG: hypothetical protein AABZ30_04315 [Myxococcota bacterium]
MASFRWCEGPHVVKDFAGVARVRANAARLGQVLLNLLVNAAQAIPPGKHDENHIRVSAPASASRSASSSSVR